MRTNTAMPTARRLTATPIQRTTFTWLAYALLGAFAYLESMLGPVMPFLRSDLHLDYAAGSLHVSALALGIIVAGLVADRLAVTWGRSVVLWAGAAGMAVGAACLALGRIPAVTIAGAVLIGAFGSLLLVMVQATLADEHGERRAVALTEANVVASASSGLAPLLVGAFARTGAGWHGALWAGVASTAVLALVGRQVVVPRPQLRARPPASVNAGTVAAAGQSASGSTGALPRVFWGYWMLAVLVVAAEWCVVVWSADYLHTVGGLSRVAAATATGAFFAAAVTARLVGSRLAGVVPLHRLLALSLMTTLLGFPLFWLAPVPVVRIAGLFITGLGIANLFPLTLSAATGVARAHVDRASARVALAVGIAMIGAPLLLGWSADRIGLERAYAFVPALVVLAAVVLYRVHATRVP